MFMDKLNNMKNNISYFIKKNIFIVLMLISLCPVLAISYAKFTINSESYRSNEMYISELLYSIKIDNENTYTIDIEPGETEHTIEITSLSGISTNYKLAYLNNNNLEVKYASDYMDASFGGIVMTRTMSLTIKNTSTEKQTLSLMVFGGYSFNEVDEIKVLETYTEIDTNYLHYDYETTALYIDNTRVDKLDSTKKYKLTNYTCSNDAEVTYDSVNSIINIKTYDQTKCSLYFKEINILTDYLILNYGKLGLTKINQNATGNQNYDTTEYRYQGKEPNNYITFNDEVGVWRIIGVFEAETPNDDGTYKKEYKVKIVRDNIKTAAWSYKESNVTQNKNDWTTATLMTLLNSGPYYNRTKGYTQLACSTGYDTTVNSSAICNYENNGLTDNAKNQISDTRWYLGNAIYNNGYGNIKELYAQERSTNVYSGNKQTWDGKVGLIYPSDYMYASSACYNDDTKKGSNYKDETCISTNWLFSGSWYWAISPCSADTYGGMFIHIDGLVSSALIYSNDGDVRPTLYLNSNITYNGGSGNIDDPFIIK